MGEARKVCQRGNRPQYRAKAVVILEAQIEKKKVHFATLMDICHLKKRGVRTKSIKSTKGRVVLRSDIVKDGSGSCAVFTEQGSSESQMTAAKVMDVMARLPDCAGQASNAVSDYTQVKMEEDPRLLKIPESERPDIWIRLPRHTWPKSRSKFEDPVVPLERNVYGHPLAGLQCERQFEEVLLGPGMEKEPNWVCLFVHRKQGLFLSVYVDDIKLTGKKQHVDPMWKVLNKEVDKERTNIFPGSCILGLHSKTM